MENSIYISKLLKELSEGSDKLSQQELESLEYANPSLKEERSEIEHIWKISESYKTEMSFDSNAAFAKFKSNNIDNRIEKVSAEPKVFFLRRRFVFSSIAASVAILVAGWFMFFSAETISNDSSHIQKHLLADGSIMHLMPESKVKLSSSFGASNRNISLNSGIALFNVEKSQTPFEVNLGNSVIEVTGTLFSVKKSDDISINLFEGSINYEVNNVLTQCSAGQSIFHDSKGGVVKSNSVDNSILDFIDNKLSFDKTPLDEVILRLESFYNVSISSEVAIPNDLHFTSTLLDQASLKSILETLEVSFDAKIQKDSESEYTIISLAENK